MEKPSAAAMAPQLLRNLIISALFFADKALLYLPVKWQLLDKLRFLLVSCFLFFLRSLPSVFCPDADSSKAFKFSSKNHESTDLSPTSAGGGDSGIARAISQLLSSMNEIPVSSRKYEVVRSLAERLIDENRGENSASLIDVNRRVLTASFARTLGRLEAAVERDRPRDLGEPIRYGLNRVVRVAMRAVGDGLTGKGGEEAEQWSAEKLAAEVLWLSEKMVTCGFGEEAVEKWASASSLARLALWAEPRLQGSMVQISAFLFKQVKEMGKGEGGEKDKWRLTKKKMLTSWLPLLCRASNGAEKPFLRTVEQTKLERVLEETISELKIEDQEQVLSLWLHHFTHCSSSDWPNLHASYARWCSSSRKIFLFQSK
ncbi:PREDICTED: uncharacterized protein LOC104799930 [Tarenaya hassleriana]|uniref:uncharacterized protein LOC104799930 n=1 Tax=Tarenaya hassleriana TaxID=28532 RepID=UPI00053C6F45|nr:PREDICTED: uncharacterized protein LOC104799930 [Tarenaya hassleriana]